MVYVHSALHPPPFPIAYSAVPFLQQCFVIACMLSMRIDDWWGQRIHESRFKGLKFKIVMGCYCNGLAAPVSHEYKAITRLKLVQIAINNTVSV